MACSHSVAVVVVGFDSHVRVLRIVAFATAQRPVGQQRSAIADHLLERI